VITVACVVAVVATIGFRLTAGPRDRLEEPRTTFQAAVQRPETR